MSERSAEATILSEVLDVLERRCVRVLSIDLGPVHIKLSAPWPPILAPPARKLVNDDEDPKLEPLRRESLKLFGHIKPDETLLQMHADGLL